MVHPSGMYRACLGEMAALCHHLRLVSAASGGRVWPPCLPCSYPCPPYSIATLRPFVADAPHRFRRSIGAQESRAGAGKCQAWNGSASLARGQSVLRGAVCRFGANSAVARGNGFDDARFEAAPRGSSAWSRRGQEPMWDGPGRSVNRRTSMPTRAATLQRTRAVMPRRKAVPVICVILRLFLPNPHRR